MFDPLENTGENTGSERLHFTFDGRPYSCAPGHSVASALLAAGLKSLRNTPVSGAPRGPFCMMGACYDCLVRVNGATVQACMTPVTEGLAVERAHKTSQEEVA